MFIEVHLSLEVIICNPLIYATHYPSYNHFIKPNVRIHLYRKSLLNNFGERKNVILDGGEGFKEKFSGF